MTPIQACEETKELWTEMARIAREENKAVEKWEVPGPWQLYKHQCPVASMQNMSIALVVLCKESGYITQ